MSTQTPVKTTREERVVLIPEARPPRPWGLIVALTLVVLLALVVGAVAGSISQHGAIHSRDAQIAAARGAADQASAASARALAQASEATALLDGLRTQLSDRVEALSLLRARAHESAATVRDMRAQVAAIRARFAQVRHHAALLTGAALPKGRYAVRLVAVGALQSPPRLVFDLGTWLRGKAARKAAIADGFIPAGGHLPHHRYFRNLTVAWRVLPVASDARVSIRNSQGRPLFGKNLVQLQDILDAQGAQARRLLHDPFWLGVRGGTIVSVQRQPYP